MSIKENISKIKKEIPSGVILVAATKARKSEEIKEAIEAGIEIIGENYVQEAEKKYSELKGIVKFHFIGHMQKNKVKKAVEIFDMIETVDSVDIAEEIDEKTQKVMPVLIEVNIGREENKNGVMPDMVVQLVREISKLGKIKLLGLMAMAPYSENKESYRPYFKEMRGLFDNLKSLNMPNVEMQYLSMGMSDSYKVAIEEGANIVRIGTKVFGDKKG